MIQLLVILAAAGATYFFAMWVWSLGAHRSMTAVERTNAEIEEARRIEDRLPLRERPLAWMRSRGYYGSTGPLLVLWGFGYVVILAVLQFFGIDLLWGLILGAPATFGLSLGVVANLQSRRRRLFNHQLLQMFDLLAAQIESGSGVQRALEQIIPALRDPLRGELVKVLEATIAAKPLVEAVHDMADRWPSRGMSMFVSALDLDSGSGAQLAPALRQSAAIIQRNEDLVAEAQAELAQTRMEFNVVAAVIALLAAWIVLGGDEQSRAAFFSLAGIIALTLAVANYAIGVYRAWRLFTRMKEII